MTAKSRKEVVPYPVQEHFCSERTKLFSSREWNNFIKADKSLYQAALKDYRFDPRFNAVDWANDVSSLCRQIVFSYCWMNAYAQFYKEKVSPESQAAHVDFHVMYFADNCITRIDSCRDKLALLVWAFYCPFNPERKNEVLDYARIVERLEHPVRFGLRLSKAGDFLNSLKLLEGLGFQRVENYRHLKIHRREPRIEIYGIAPHHDWSYMFPLTDKKEIARWEKELEKQYPDPVFRSRIKEGCYVNGVLFERRKIKDRLWDFSEVQKDLDTCLFKLLEASSTCFRLLRQRLISRKRFAFHTTERFRRKIM